MGKQFKCSSCGSVLAVQHPNNSSMWAPVKGRYFKVPSGVCFKCGAEYNVELSEYDHRGGSDTKVLKKDDMDEIDVVEDTGELLSDDEGESADLSESFSSED